MLITSRNPNWQEWVASPFKVDLVPPEEAEQFLLRRTGTNDEGVARELADELGTSSGAGASRCVHERERQTPARVSALFAARGSTAGGDPIDYTGTVDTTVQMAVDRLTPSPAAVVLCGGLLSWHRRKFPERLHRN